MRLGHQLRSSGRASAWQPSESISQHWSSSVASGPPLASASAMYAAPCGPSGFSGRWSARSTAPPEMALLSRRAPTESRLQRGSASLVSVGFACARAREREAIGRRVGSAVRFERERGATTTL